MKSLAELKVIRDQLESSDKNRGQQATESIPCRGEYLGDILKVKA